MVPIHKPPPENLQEALDDLRGAWFWLVEAVLNATLRRWFRR